MGKRTFLNASFVFVGVWAVILGVLWNLLNYEDEGPRCTIAACSQSTLNWYWFVAEASTATVVIGTVVVILGLWLSLRRANKPE